MKIRTCPNCGSTDIGMDRTLGIAGNMYKCKKCWYTGDIIIERDVEKKFKS
ncbi:hypothetical protein J4470_00485 [Candidatus Woesearchaeota archaeon]|nr:hypothetical protein [Candidatus Woesearchaeota archaeon]